MSRSKAEGMLGVRGSVSRAHCMSIAAKLGQIYACTEKFFEKSYFQLAIPSPEGRHCLVAMVRDIQSCHLSSKLYCSDRQEAPDPFVQCCNSVGSGHLQVSPSGRNMISLAKLRTSALADMRSSQHPQELFFALGLAARDRFAPFC